MLHSLAMNTDQGFSKENTSVLVVLIFIPALSHSATKSVLMYVEDQIQWKKAKPIICEQQTIDLAISNCGTLVGLTSLNYPVCVNYEMRGDKMHPCLRPTWNGFDCVDTNTDFWLVEERLNSNQQLTINDILL